MTKNRSHVKGPHADREFPSNDRLDTRDLEARNEARSEGLPGKEPHNVRTAGGGVVGKNLGGAHTGRYAGAPGKVTSNRERKPRGRDKE